MIKASDELSQSLVDELQKAGLYSPILYCALKLETSPISALATACIAMAKHIEKQRKKKLVFRKEFKKKERGFKWRKD